MSLRLSPEPDSPRPAAPSPGGDPVAERAAQCLATGEFDRYAALFDEAAGVAPPYRRYRLQRDLLEAGLHVSGPVPAPRLAALYLSLARAGVTMLEVDPREPVIANLTGVAL